MAVERIAEFAIDLSNIVKTRLDSFSAARQRVQATEESTFQRSIVDNDLSYDDQLKYRQEQLAREGEKQYPDNDFIDKIKTSITGLKKMVRYRKFRDSYFTFLTDLASGKKALEDHIAFLQDSLNDDNLDTEIKDELENTLTSAIESKRQQDLKIIDSQIIFYQQDKTMASINSAVDLVKSQLSNPNIQKDNALRTSYELQLRTLQKEKQEIDVEDKANWTAIQLISTSRTNPSLWKLETFAGFRDKAGVDSPINVGGVRYNSEREYWEATLYNYIQNSFATEYATETKGVATMAWNKVGMLPDTYLNNLISTNNIIRTNPELANFQQVITSAIQDSISTILSFKAKDLTAEYYLDKPDVATEADYQKAKQELENLKVLFGADYSLSPDIQAVETLLVQKRVQTTQNILKTAAEYAEAEGITLEEAIKKYGPTAAVEVPAETFKTKTPMEVAEQIAKEAKEAITPTPTTPTPAPTTPTPTPTPTPTTPSPAPTGGQAYKIQSGDSLSKIAAMYGTTVDAIIAANAGNPGIKTKDLIYAGYSINIPTTQAPTPAPTPTPTPTPAPTPTPTPTPTPAPTPAPTPQPTYYTVKSGETLWGIAQSQLGAGARWKELKTPEGIGFTEETAKKLQIGQKILIPTK